MEGEAAPLAVRLFGEPAILRGGAALPLPASRKTRSLFVVLLLADRPQRRDRLCERLWDIPDDPRAALRWSLTKLRQTLGDDADLIVADRDHVGLDRARIAVDLDAMREARDPEQLLALADAALEPPLLGLDLAHLDRYAAWLAAERAGADRVRAALLKRAAVLPGVPRDRVLRYLDAARDADPGDEVAVPAPPPVDQTIRYCVTADDVRIAYACTGEGPPLVKAANWLNHLELDWDSPAWGGMFRALSRDHMLVRYDERGNGLSDWDVADLSFAAFVGDLEMVVDSLGLDRFPLLGISQGCAVSIEYAWRHPERVSRLILLGGYAAGWRVDGDAAMREQREAAITLVRHGWGQDNPAYRQIFSNSFMPSATAAELDWFNEFQRRTASAENAVRFLEAFADIDVRHSLADIRAPTLVIHARGDQRVALSHGIELAAGIRGATLQTIDTDNHMPLAREPASDVLVDAIRRFLKAE